MNPNRRKELVEQFKQIKTYMGVYQIKNMVNGKIYIGSSPNLKNKWLTLQGQLNMNRFTNAKLQQDWNEFGEKAFQYEVLVQKEPEDGQDRKWVLKQMVKTWLEKLQPYDEKGYNNRPKG